MDRYLRERILSPEAFTGRLFCRIKAFVDILILLCVKPSKQSMRQAYIILKVIPRYTMLSVNRLLNLYNLAIQVNKIGISGDIVECGVWNGGSAAVMAYASSISESEISGKRRLWLFDSFQGLPEPTEEDGESMKNKKFKGLFRGNIENVKKSFEAFGLSLQEVHIIEGWLDDTLANASVVKIALLHIDLDLHRSYRVCFEKLYDKISPGGFIVCDDYSWEGARQAIDIFMKGRGLSGNVQCFYVDKSIYFQKPFITAQTPL